jgi:enoyl-CoA hydratase/carnithine racemase
MTAAATIEVRREKDIAVLTLNRPRRRNALTREVREGLAELLTTLAADDSVRAVVVASREQAFSAGQDLTEAKEFSPEEITRWIDEHMALYRAVLAFPKPVVAAVDGCCVGAGFQFALLCDLRVAGEAAFFAMPELDDAIPCILGVWTLYDTIGRGRTVEMALTNRRVYAAEAREWGLVAEVVPGDPTPRALELADLLAGKPALALRLTKARLELLALEGSGSLAVHAQLAHMRAFASGEPAKAMEQFLTYGRQES